MKLIFTLILMAVFLRVSGQGIQPAGIAEANLDVTNINAYIRTGGDAFNKFVKPTPPFNSTIDVGFEVPRGSGKHTMFSNALWLGGQDASGKVYAATQMYRQKTAQFGYDASFEGLTQAGFWPGPIAATHTPAHNVKYDKIWKVSRAEIDYHIANFRNAGYNTPADILTWPGNGNIANGEAARLAPFADRNNDGIYSPNLGEYPLIKGDQALYIILNDKGNTKVPASPSMNAEVHIMYYGFDNPANEAIFNTVFAEYRIINRGQLNFQDFYAGIWTDFDLGFFNDDYVGCDTINNRYYAYNGDDNDEGPEGYGLNPPMQSVTFLDQKMSSFVYYNNYSDPKDGNPWQTISFYNYLRGRWMDGSLITSGRDGTFPNYPSTKYMFPGDPDSKQGWTEKNVNPNSTMVGNTPADRRGVGSIGPFNLNAGAELKFTVAYTYSRPVVGGQVISCNFLGFQNAGETRKFFSEMKPEPVAPILDNVLIWPNPVLDVVQFQLPGLTGRQQVTFHLSDNVGKIVYKTTLETENGRSLPLNMGTLKKGMYLVTITSGNLTIKDRLVKL